MKRPTTQRCNQPAQHLMAAIGVLLSMQASASTLFPTLAEQATAQWGVGLAALVENEGYRGVGAETEAMPVLFYQGERLRILGPQATYRLLGDKRTNIGLRVDYRFDGFEVDDGDIFRGMDERKSSLALGVSGKVGLRVGEILFSAAKTRSASKGVYATIQYALPTAVGLWTVTPRVGFEYFDSKYTNYYFGVRQHEGRADRAAYQPGSSVNLDAGVDLHRDLGRHHTLFGSIKYRRHGSAIKDSPLIDKAGSPRLNIGYMYRF